MSVMKVSNQSWLGLSFLRRASMDAYCKTDSLMKFQQKVASRPSGPCRTCSSAARNSSFCVGSAVFAVLMRGRPAGLAR